MLLPESGVRDTAFGFLLAATSTSKPTLLPFSHTANVAVHRTPLSPQRGTGSGVCVHVCVCVFDVTACETPGFFTFTNFTPEHTERIGLCSKKIWPKGISISYQ